MPKYSKRSLSKLHTCVPTLQIVMSYVIRKFDNSIIHGQRTPEFQFELFQKGRKLIGGVWVVVNEKEVVTNCDGTKIKSRHNKEPLSEAVDAVPFPTLYSDIDTIRHFAGYVLGVADMLYAYGAIEQEVICGIDWDNDKDLKDQKLFDAVHFQTKRIKI
jgi:peptidoglycan LD-endopeptidase CwlK